MLASLTRPSCMSDVSVIFRTPPPFFHLSRLLPPRDRSIQFLYLIPSAVIRFVAILIAHIHCGHSSSSFNSFIVSYRVYWGDICVLSYQYVIIVIFAVSPGYICVAIDRHRCCCCYSYGYARLHCYCCC